MNVAANQKYNIIEVLQLFINDIYEFNTKVAEAKHVNKELDKSTQKLNATIALTGYKKNVYGILGYKIDFGLNYWCDLITSIKFTEKMAGYNAMSLLFKNTFWRSDVEIMINSIKNYDFNKTLFHNQWPLLYVESPELLESIARSFFEIIESFKEKAVYFIKKTLIIAGKF